MYFNDDTSMKDIFDIVSGSYDRARPDYPLEMYSVVKHLLDLDEDRTREKVHILEVGSGSGQATKHLADLGGYIDCAEPGKNFCGILEEKFSSLDKVNIYRCDFETFSTSVKYDVVFSGCAFHWIDPEILFSKSAEMLNESGWLIGVWHMPKFSDAIYEIIDKVIVCHTPEFEIPRGTRGQVEYFDVGIQLMLDTGVYTNHKKIFFHSQSKLSPKKATDLIWSYVNAASFGERSQNIYEQLLREVSSLKEEELHVDNIFPFAAGQRVNQA